MIPSILAVLPLAQRTTCGCVGDRNSTLFYPMRVSPRIALISRTSR